MSNKTSKLSINDFTVGVDTLSIDGVIIDGSSLPSNVTATENNHGYTTVHFSDDETIDLHFVTLAEFLT